MLEKMVVLLQQSVPPIYATCFSKKYSMKLRLLSRTWPNISKLEHTVLILRPSMFIAAVVKRLVPASLNAWRHWTASVQKGADGWKWPKPKTHWKNKKQRGVLAGPRPSKDSRNIVFFLFFQGFYQRNWHESQAKLSKCLWECSKTSQNIILNHGNTALPGAVVPFLFCWHCLTALLNFSFFCFARNNW